MKIKFLCTCVVMILLLWGCKKDKTTPDYPEGSNEQINTWILDSLRKYYYWSDAIPKKANPGQSPSIFFNSVRNVEDRFSWLYLPGDANTFVLTSRSLYGFDYAVIEEPANHQVFGLIKSVLKGSPAERYGLKRGDCIRKINGVEFSKDRVAVMEKDLLSGRTSQLTLAKFQDGLFYEERELNILAGLTPYAQPAVYQILESGSLKVAYVYIDDFSAGTVNALLPIFSQFKNKGVSELVLDLRYNSGGEVSEAAALCAMIPVGITGQSPFITYKGNKNGGTRNETIGTAATYGHLIDFKALQQCNLGLSRVFVLATGATASAAELVINNLKPYIPLKVIGERTLGKDEASFLINDQRSPKKVAWEMYPIIYKLFNASGQGGYSKGISPDITINEFSQLPLLPAGDANDPLLKTALNQIGFGKSVSTAMSSGYSKTAILSKSVPDNPPKVLMLSDTHQDKASGSLVFTHR